MLWCHTYEKLWNQQLFLPHLLKHLLCSCVIAIFECFDEAEKWFYVPKIFRSLTGFNMGLNKNLLFEAIGDLYKIIYIFLNINFYLSRSDIFKEFSSFDIFFIYLNIHNIPYGAVCFWIHNHPVRIKLKISFSGIPILVQEIANEPSLTKLFPRLTVFLDHLFS